MQQQTEKGDCSGGRRGQRVSGTVGMGSSGSSGFLESDVGVQVGMRLGFSEAGLGIHVKTPGLFPWVVGSL